MDVSAACSAAAGGTRVAVRVVPRGASSRIVGLHGAAVKARLAAPPVDGAANAALLALFADVLGVRARDLVVTAGGRSRDGSVLVTGVGPQACAQRLATAGGAS